jgi:hypothetical protein
MRRILFPPAAAVAALALASPAAAQEPTFVRPVAVTTVATDSAARARALAAPVVMARDSALRYERLAGRQRLQGNSLVVAGAALLAGGLLHHYTQDRPMVMSAGSGAVALGGVATALYGVRRRDAGARSQLAADLWTGAATTVDVTRRP